MKKICNIDKITDLFDSWKDAHKTDEEYEKYKTEGIDKNYFCYDGIINEGDFCGLLFICKESHIDKDEPIDKDNYFWLREVAKGEKKPGLFGTRLSIIANAYFNNNEGLSVLKKVALVNLNKRGGKSSTEYKKLDIYTKKYATYIAKEIDIIKPKVIVLCGTKTLFDTYISKKLDKYKSEYSPKIISLYHPSYKRISHKNYLNDFLNQNKQL